jgi:predicted alpha/beta-fold hydrolase
MCDIYTSNEECQELLSKCPSLHMPNYFIFLFGLGKHIQIILYMIKNFIQIICNPNFYGMRWESEICILPDGEESILDWAITPNAESGLDSSDAKTPILMIHPGALGNRKTLMGQWVKRAHLRGWIVCVHNRRGHSKLLTLPKWNFFGSVEDVEYITTNYILKRRPNAILLKLGISAGSGLAIKCFVKNTQFAAGVGISPGIGIKKSMGRPEWPYNGFIVNGMKNFLQQNKHILQNVIGYKECMNAKNPQEFTNNCWAMAGYSSMEEYYKNECSMDAFTNIKNPLLLLNAADDPIAVKQNILDWKYLANYKCHKGMFVLTDGGSHCAFLEGIFMDSWSERVTFEYFDVVISSL